MNQSDKALVSPMPLHLPFPVPSFFALVIGMAVAWTLLLLLAQALRNTAMGKRLHLVVPTYLVLGMVFLLLALIAVGATLISSIIIRDMLIGLLWGAAFDMLMLLLWFCLVLRWQYEDSKTSLTPKRSTVIRNNRNRRPVVGKLPARNTRPRYSIAESLPTHARTRKPLPKRTGSRVTHRLEAKHR